MKKLTLFQAIDTKKNDSKFHSMKYGDVIKLVEQAWEESKSDVEKTYYTICKSLGGQDKINCFFRCYGYEKEYFTLFNVLESFDRPRYILLEKFIKHGLNINLQDGEGNTPLILQLACGNHDEALKLLELLQKNKNSCSPNLDIKGYDSVNSSDGEDYSNTALTITLAKGYELESYHHSLGKMEQTYNASNNYLVVVKKIIEYGANVNIAGPHGLTPLHIAYLRHDRKAVQLLLDHGANSEETDEFGHKPNHYIEFNYEEAKKLIKQVTQGFFVFPDEKKYEHDKGELPRLNKMGRWL